MESPDPETNAPDAPTRWSRIRELDYEHLVRRYWSPVRRFLGSRLSVRDDAEEATQELFVRLFEKDVLARADREKGTFRSFLFHIARQFLIDRYREGDAVARRSDRRVPLEAVAEDAPSRDPAPAEAFDREWYLSLLNGARRALKAELEGRGRIDAYRAFRLFFFGDASARRPSYRDVASELGLTFEQVKKHIERGRAAYHGKIREAIAEYARDETEVEDELRDLGRFLERHRLHAFPPSSILSSPPDGAETRET